MSTPHLVNGLGLIIGLRGSGGWCGMLAKLLKRLKNLLRKGVKQPKKRNGKKHFYRRQKDGHCSAQCLGPRRPSLVQSLPKGRELGTAAPRSRAVTV